jgi:hypothetical protein
VVEQASEGMALVDSEHLRILEGDADFSQTPLPELLAVPAPEVTGWIEQVRKEGQASLGERRYRQPSGQELEIEINRPAPAAGRYNSRSTSRRRR